MQTKFKWKDKQRLLMIRGLSMGIIMSQSLDAAHNLAEDIFAFSKYTPEQINSDESIQKKLKFMFILQKQMNVNQLYEELVMLDKYDETTSFAA